jgi:hypothetical protein
MCEASTFETPFHICRKVQLVPMFYFMILAFIWLVMLILRIDKIQRSLADR